MPTSLLARHDTSLLSLLHQPLSLSTPTITRNKLSSQCRASQAVSQSSTTPPQQAIASSNSLRTSYLFSNRTMHPCKSTPSLTPLTSTILILVRLTMESSDSSAVIKTPTKTYALRQKNTSNALMLLSPTPLPTSSDGPVEQGISIISTINETVELDTVPDVSAGTAKGLGGGKGKWHERFGRNR